MEELENNNEVDLWKWWKKYGEHLVAPLILFALIFLGYNLYQDNQLKQIVSKNCGWAEEDYQCYCKKSDVTEIKASQNPFNQNILLFVNETNDSFSHFDPDE